MMVDARSIIEYCVRVRFFSSIDENIERDKTFFWIRSDS